MWKAFGEGHLSEAEAEALSALIEARQLSRAAHSGGQPEPNGNPCACVTDARRIVRTGSGRAQAPGRARMPVLSADAVGRLLAGSLRLSPRASPWPNKPRSPSWRRDREAGRLPTCHRAPSIARRCVPLDGQERDPRGAKLGLLTVEERRVTGFRNDTNVVRIVSPEWTAWLRLARKGIGIATPWPWGGEAPPPSIGGGSNPQPARLLRF